MLSCTSYSSSSFIPLNNDKYAISLFFIFVKLRAMPTMGFSMYNVYKFRHTISLSTTRVDSRADRKLACVLFQPKIDGNFFDQYQPFSIFSDKWLSLSFIYRWGIKNKTNLDRVSQKQTDMSAKHGHLTHTYF